MARPKTTEQIINEMADAIAAKARDAFMETFYDYSHPVEDWTPIEQLMGYGLLNALTDVGLYGGCGDNGFADRTCYTTFEATDTSWPDHIPFGITIYPQMKIGKYCADFVASVKDYSGGEIVGVIECDGHDYHERTKEQARHDKERDRYFQSIGLLVLRYTGSEIYRDPVMTAAGALGILHQRARALKWGKKK